MHEPLQHCTLDIVTVVTACQHPKATCYQWKFPLREAIIKDNDIHDELFEGEGSDGWYRMQGAVCRIEL